MVIDLRPDSLTFADIVAVARHDHEVRVPGDVRAAVAATRRAVEALAHADRPVYGVSTGFGALAQRHIPAELRTQLQKSLIRSHAAGVGDPVEREVVRALMLLRARTMATGRTGVRAEVLDTYVAMLNAGITPVVHEYGSLGCSGDLAPLSACALAAMGEGPVQVRGASGVVVAAIGNGTSHAAGGASGEERELPAAAGASGGEPELPAAEALAAAGITPLVLEEKEGLALVNGTDGMLGMLILALFDLENLFTAADLTAAMSVEAQLGTDRVFMADLHAPLRPHPGQAASAANMRDALADSPMVAAHKDSSHLVQDAYSLRCAPQVTGAARDTAAFAAQTAARELRAAIDNPVVLDDGSVSSNGNFHGAPLAYALDFLAIVAADVASIAERRTDRFMDVARSQGLPPFLAADPGVDSGLMIAHYSQAAIVSEMKRQATPASVDSIPSSAMQEDHVSMGWTAARKLRQSVANLARVLGIEYCAAARAADLREQDPGPVTSTLVAELRTAAPGPGPDRFLTPELAAAIDRVADGRMVAAAEAVRPLQHTLVDTDGAVLTGRTVGRSAHR